MADKQQGNVVLSELYERASCNGLGLVRFVNAAHRGYTFFRASHLLQTIVEMVSSGLETLVVLEVVFSTKTR